MTALIAANRIAAIGVSEIPQIGARAAAMKYAGAPAIILGAGEPDFDTPDHVKDAAAAAIWRGDAKYTALDGTPDLKAAICRKFACENGWEVTPAEVTVTSGAKQINYNAMMATLTPGDEVIIPTPYWTTYSDIVCWPKRYRCCCPAMMRRALVCKRHNYLQRSPHAHAG